MSGIEGRESQLPVPIEKPPIQEKGKAFPDRIIPDVSSKAKRVALQLQNKARELKLEEEKKEREKEKEAGLPEKKEPEGKAEEAVKKPESSSPKTSTEESGVSRETQEKKPGKPPSRRLEGKRLKAPISQISDIMGALGAALREELKRMIRERSRAQRQKKRFREKQRKNPLQKIHDFVEIKEVQTEEQEESKPTIPVIDIPFPFAAAPFLIKDKPITASVNEARIKILLMMARRTLNKPQTLTDLLERGKLLVEGGLAVMYPFKSMTENYEKLKEYLAKYPDKSYLLLEKIIAGDEKTRDIPASLLKTASEVAGTMDDLEDLSQKARTLYQQPPTLWPSMFAGELDVNLLLHQLSFFTAHLARLEVSEKEAKEYLVARVESEKMPLQYQIRATLPRVSLRERYGDDSRILMPYLKFADIQTTEIVRMSSDNPPATKKIEKYLLGHPPRRAFQAVLKRYQSILEGFGISLPEVSERRFDVSFLVLSQAHQETAANPQKLLSLYKREGAKLASFCTKRLPLIYYIWARTNLAAGITDSGRLAPDLISWLRQDGLNQIIIFADKEQTDFYDVPKLKIEDYDSLDLSESSDWFVKIDDVLSLLYYYETKIPNAYSEKDNPIFALTKLVHPDFSLKTLNRYPTITRIILGKMIEDGLLKKEKDTVHLTPKTPVMTSLPFLAKLARITDPEKIKSFCQEFVNAVRTYSHAKTYSLLTSERTFPHYVKAADLQEQIKQALAQPEPKFGLHQAGLAPAALWFLPSGYGPYVASQRVFLSDGSTAERELALEGGIEDEAVETSALLKSLNHALYDLRQNLPFVYVGKLRRARKNRRLYDKPGGQDVAEQRLSRVKNKLEQVESQIKEVEANIEKLRLQGTEVRKEKLFNPLRDPELACRSEEIEARRLLEKQSQLIGEKWSLSARKENLELVVGESEKAFADPELPVERMVDIFIRPLLSSFTLSVLSVSQVLDKDISQECDREKLERFGTKNREGQIRLTAKSLAVGKLLNIVNSLDNLMDEAPAWLQVDALLEEAETVLRNFQEQMKREDLPFAETKLVKLPGAKFEENVWSPEVSEPRVVSEPVEEVKPKRPFTIAEWREIFARYSLEELRVLRNTLWKEFTQEEVKKPAVIKRIKALFNQLTGNGFGTKTESMTKADFERIIDFLSEIIKEKESY